MISFSAIRDSPLKQSGTEEKEAAVGAGSQMPLVSLALSANAEERCDFRRLAMGLHPLGGSHWGRLATTWGFASSGWQGRCVQARISLNSFLSRCFPAPIFGWFGGRESARSLTSEDDEIMGRIWTFLESDRTCSGLILNSFGTGFGRGLDGFAPYFATSLSSVNLGELMRWVWHEATKATHSRQIDQQPRIV
jgi:hypothetical protein